MKKYLIICLCLYAFPLFLEAQTPSSQQFAFVYQDEKKGCIDINGKVIIPAEYDFINAFREGLAMVNKGGEYDDDYNIVGGLCGFYDHQGQLVIPIEHEEAASFSDGLAMIKKNGKYGFINKQGQNIIPCEYEEARSFSDGLAVVKIKKKYGAIDQKGKLVIPAVYDEINDFNEGLAAIYHFQKMVVDPDYGSSYQKGKYGLINKSNVMILDTIYDYVGYFANGMAKIRKDQKYGMIDPQGKSIIPLEYDLISDFVDGIALVGKYADQENEMDLRYGYMDRNGKILIDFQFPYAYDFKDGIALVEKDYSSASYNLIDLKGNYLLDENHYDISQTIQDSTFLLHNDDYSLSAYKIGHGKLTPAGYEKLNPLGNGFFYVEEQYNGDGAIISNNKIAKVKDYFYNLEAGYKDHFIATVVTDNEYDLVTKMGLINSKGQWILEPKYDTIDTFFELK